MARSSFGKLERDRAKKAKAKAKREKRQERGEETEGDAEPVAAPPADDAAQAQILQAIEALHARFDDHAISYEEFEEQKAELMSRLSVD